MFPEHSLEKDNKTKISTREFLNTLQGFKDDKSIDNKIMITVALEGYLKRIDENINYFLNYR